jgi:hypothetical protein
MTAIDVIARPWGEGWELEIDEDNITQVRDLDHARQQVIDYLDTAQPEIEHADWQINLIGVSER